MVLVIINDRLDGSVVGCDLWDVLGLGLGCHGGLWAGNYKLSGSAVIMSPYQSKY